jgi:putative DNA methylase
LDPTVGKRYRAPTNEERLAVQRAEEALAREPDFGPGLPAVPDEEIPESNGATIRPQLYGARTYGDLSNRRQTLSFVRLARVINGLGQDLLDLGFSHDYAAALTGYASARAVEREVRRRREALGDRLHTWHRWFCPRCLTALRRTNDV